MINILKRYWLLILIVLIIVNFLGFYLAKETIGISDALEHVESDEVIVRLKRKNFFYTVFVYLGLIIDSGVVLFVLSLIIKSIVKKLKLSKK